MSSSFGRSFFGDVTARIQRLLDLEGIIPVDLGKVVTPVVVVADGTLPGYGDQKLRRFGGSCQLAAPAATGGLGFTCEHGPGVIITAAQFTSTGNCSFSLSYQGPDGAFPWAMTSQTCFMIDRSRNVETAPVLSGVLANPPEPPGVFWRSEQQSVAPSQSLGISPFYMMQGGKLCLHISSAIGGEFSIMGMLL